MKGTAYAALSAFLLLLTSPAAMGQRIGVGPQQIQFTMDEGAITSVQPGAWSVGVGPPTGFPEVTFQLTAAYEQSGVGPNPFIISPTSGATPASVRISLNPAVAPYLGPGRTSYIVQFASGLPATSDNSGVTIITLVINRPPAPTINDIVNVYPLQSSISPGSIVSIFGNNLGPAPMTGTSSVSFLGTSPGAPAISGQFYPTTLGNTTVTFNGIPAPLLYVTASQINAVVPYEVPGRGTASVVVTHDSDPSTAFQAPTLATTPAIFASSPDASGQGAILNRDPTGGATTLNSAANPAPKGSTIVIFAAGAGRLNQTPQDGAILTSVLDPPGYVPLATLSLTIGGQPATVLYAGAAPNQVAGVLQVNAVVPNGI